VVSASAFLAPGKPKGKKPCHRESRNPDTQNLDVLGNRKEKFRMGLECPSRETRGERSESGESSKLSWTVGSTLSRTIDLLHGSPYQNLEIYMT
jgi:hypothetical protein